MKNFAYAFGIGGIVAGAVAVVSQPVFADGYQDTEPVGQKACYEVDRDHGRTSWAIRDAQAEVRIHRPASGAGDAVDTVLDTSVEILFFGDDRITFAVETPRGYFEEGFWQRFSADARVLAFGQFKMELLETGDVQIGGQVYEDAHKIRIFDVDTSRSVDLRMMLGRLLAIEQGRAPNLLESAQAVEELEIKAWIHESVPGLGALTLDLIGKRYGMTIYAGLNYTTDPSQCVTQ